METRILLRELLADAAKSAGVKNFKLIQGKHPKIISHPLVIELRLIDNSVCIKLSIKNVCYTFPWSDASFEYQITDPDLNNKLIDRLKRAVNESWLMYQAYG